MNTICMIIFFMVIVIPTTSVAMESPNVETVQVEYEPQASESSESEEKNVQTPWDNFISWQDNDGAQNTAFHIAVEKKNIPFLITMVKTVIDKPVVDWKKDNRKWQWICNGADENPLHYIAKSPDIRISQEQLNALPDMWLQGKTKKELYFPFHSAAQVGNVNLLVLMINRMESEYDIDNEWNQIVDNSGDTPLHTLISHYQTINLESLKKMPIAWFKHKNSSMNTPLHLAAFYLHDQATIQNLIKRYPEAVNLQNKAKQTPLQHSLNKVNKALGAGISLQDTEYKNKMITLKGVIPDFIKHTSEEQLKILKQSLDDNVYANLPKNLKTTLITAINTQLNAGQKPQTHRSGKKS